MTDAQKYAGIAFAGSGITVATVTAAIAIAVRTAMRIARRDPTFVQESQSRH